MRLSHPFIKLPFSFDANKLAEEMDNLPTTAWMAHPSGMAGNSAAALISHNGGDNDNFGGRMAENANLSTMPYHRQVMASLGEVLGRSRLMKLAAGSEVSPHVDFNYHWYSRLRVHVPVTTNPDVIFHCGDDAIHMQPGECWIFDSWRWHRVVNGGQIDRVHLVFDLAGSSRFWQMVEEVERGDPEIRQVAFEPDSAVELLVEKFNTAPVMAPGEVEAIAREIIRDFETQPDNPPELVTLYRKLLTNFGHDWREIWHLHGQGPDGWPKYRQLIQQTQQQLHPEIRALVTASNNVGINPIVVQRLLRAALAPGNYDDFVAK